MWTPQQAWRSIASLALLLALLAAAPRAALSAAPPASAYWTFNGCSNTPSDSITGTSGALVGSASVFTCATPPPSGAPACALAFGADDSAMTVSNPVPAAFNFNGATDFTVSAWVFRSQLPSDRAQVVNRWNSLDQFMLAISQNSLAFFSVAFPCALGDVGGGCPSSWGRAFELEGGVVPFNRWTMLTATLRGSDGTMSLFINGQQVATLFVTTLYVGNAVQTTDRPLSVGSHPSYNTFNGGRVDCLALWKNASLSAADVAETFHTQQATCGCGAAASSASPAAFWNFDVCSGNPVDSASGANITLSRGSLATYSNCALTPLASCTMAFSDTSCSRTNNCDDTSTGSVLSLDPVPPVLSWDGTSSMAVSVWVSRQANTDRGTLVSRWAGPDQFNLFLETSGSVGFFLAFNCITADGSCGSNGRFFEIYTGATVPLNTWTHVAGVLSGGVMAIYINGAQASSLSLSSTPNGDYSSATLQPTSMGLRVGSHPSWNQLVGSLDCVALYSTGLNSAQVAGEYADQLPRCGCKAAISCPGQPQNVTKALPFVCPTTSPGNSCNTSCVPGYFGVPSDPTSLCQPTGLWAAPTGTCNPQNCTGQPPGDGNSQPFNCQPPSNVVDGPPCNTSCNGLASSLSAVCTATGWVVSGYCGLNCTGQPQNVSKALPFACPTTSPGNSCNTSCVPGYFGVPSDPTSLCQPTGLWAAPTGTCNPQNCSGQPPAATDALPWNCQPPSNVVDGPPCLAGCNNSFTSAGFAAACTATGWVVSGSCRANCTGQPTQTILNANPWNCPQSTAYFPSPLACMPNCQPGFTGDPRAVCRLAPSGQQGTWEVYGSCSSLPCTNAPPDVPGAQPWNCTLPAASGGPACSTLCLPGHSPTQVTATCTAGSWSVSSSCSANACVGQPEAILNAAWQCQPTQQTPSGQSCLAACDPGFQTQAGPPEAVCSAGSFSSPLLTQQCIPDAIGNNETLLGFYLLTAATESDLNSLVISLAAAIHQGFGLPASYPVSDIVVWLQSTFKLSSHRRQVLSARVQPDAAVALAATSKPQLSTAARRKRITAKSTSVGPQLQALVGFLLAPGPPGLPPASVLQQIFNDPATTQAVADSLSVSTGISSNTGSTIARSNSVGTPQEVAQPITVDCEVSLVPAAAASLSCSGNSLTAAFYFQASNVAGLTTFAASLDGVACSPPPGSLVGPQPTRQTIIATCSPAGSAPISPGSHNLSVTATFTASNGCNGNTTATTPPAVTTITVSPAPAVALTQVLPAAPGCAAANGSTSLTIFFNFKATPSGAASGPLQLGQPVASATDPRAACTASLVPSSASSLQGQIKVVCSGRFPSPAAFAVTATLSASQPGCTQAGSDTSTATASVTCCRSGTSFALAASPSPAATFSCNKCRSSTSGNDLGGVFYQGPLSGGAMRLGITSSSSSASACAAGPDAAAVGSVDVSCGGDGRNVQFVVSNNRFSNARISFQVACNKPTPFARCASYRLLPVQPLPSNVLSLNITSSADKLTTSWVFPLSTNVCACEKVYWSVVQTGLFVDVCN